MRRASIWSLMAFSVVSLFTTVCHAKDPTPVRTISIPLEDHGYSNFRSVVLTSKTDLDAFRTKGSNAQGMGWNARKAFDQAVQRAAVDFDKESLVLLRHTEGSASTRVKLLGPERSGKRLTYRLTRRESEVGVAAMAYYCFAFAVPRDQIAEVEFVDADGTSTIWQTTKKVTATKVKTP